MAQSRFINNPSRRMFNAGTLTLLAACIVGLSAVGKVHAQAFPSKPLTIIVPFPPAGTTDILARVVGAALSTELGQPVIIDNRGGAGGNIGSAAAAKAPADAYTLLMGTVGTHAINASLYKKMPFDPIKDFAPLTRVANVPNLLVANPAQPYKTVAELITYARANPGKVNYASSGSGTSIHLSGELFKAMAKVDMVHVPYKGSAPAITDLLGNQVGIMFDNLPSAITHVRAGKLRPLAVTTLTRSPELPNVPTISEAGLPGYDATSWFGLFVPAGTPVALINRLQAAIVKVLAVPDVKKKVIEQGADVYTERPEQFAAFIQAESVKWSKVVRDSGATAD